MAVVDGPQPSGETAIRTINELFASLIPIAKASGLPLNIDAIVFVREHDLPLQQFQSAFSTINGLCLTAETEARTLMQRIKQDDQDHASGVLNVGPRMAEKENRDTEQTTKVNSTLRYLRLALDQLNPDLSW